MRFFLILSLLSFSAQAQLSQSTLESKAREFIQQKHLFPADASLSMQHLESVFKNSSILRVQNRSTGSSTLLIVGASGALALGNDMRASIGAFNMFLPAESLALKNATEAQNLFTSLLRVVEPGATGIRCESIQEATQSEFRCFYNRPYGQANAVLIKKNGSLR